MKILSAEQIRDLDKFTIKHEPIDSIDLMERAAEKFFALFFKYVNHYNAMHIFCGMGNNGGDGLAIARLLLKHGYKKVSIYVVRHTTTPSKDFQKNEKRLKKLLRIQYIETEKQIPRISEEDIVIDAIFGTGLTRKAEGIAVSVIQAINKSQAEVYSVDIPSGLFCDKSNAPKDAVIHATKTFTFHAPKLSFLFSENALYVPDYEVLDIGLMKEYERQILLPYAYITADFVQPLFKKRAKFSHKGNYGHALICAGSYGKMGAAVLAVKAALKSGAGLITANVPPCGYEIMQYTNPEAMVEVSVNQNYLDTPPVLEKYSAIGVGCGIGIDKVTKAYLKKLLSVYKKPVVIDADALNILAADNKLLSTVPESSILTPHPGEFKRLAGEWKNDSDKLKMQIAFSAKYKVMVVLKGALTSITTPGAKIYFNSTGNAGMAKGGSGDVLTGLITSLLAQGYTSEYAAIIGVYIHGLAGDFAKNVLGEAAMNATDIINYLPGAFKKFENSISDFE